VQLLAFFEELIMKYLTLFFLSLLPTAIILGALVHQQDAKVMHAPNRIPPIIIQEQSASITIDMLLSVVSELETGRKKINHHTAMRLEEHHLHRKECKGLSKPQAILCASSIGEHQVMGWHAIIRGEHPSILFSPSVNRTIAEDILTDCFARSNRNLKATFRCYNGSDAYATKAADLLLNKLVEY